MTRMDERRQAWAAAGVRQDIEDIAFYQRLLPAIMRQSMDNARALLEIIGYMESQVEGKKGGE